MKFVTFQPYEVLDRINRDGVCNAPINEDLHHKMYCLAVNEHTMERIFMCAPSMPQVAIIFETDDFEELDSVA